jgi:biotin carboxyl carrier protein
MKRNYTVVLDGEEHLITIDAVEDGYQLSLGDATHRFDVLQTTASLFSFLIDRTHVLEADVSFNQDHCELNVRNVPYHLEVFDPRRRIISQSQAGGGNGLIAAPMPGKIVEIKVAPGDRVAADQSIIVIEAMKMQNELNAPISGIVQEVTVKAGDAVEADQKLAVITPENTAEKQ